MKSQNPVPGKGRPKQLTFIVFALAVLTAACAYGYSIYSESERHEALLPRVRLHSLVRDIRKYQTLAGRAPTTFDEIEEIIWKRKGRKPVFENGGAAYTLGHYFYLLSAIDEQRATVWAVPVGERREEASTHFVVVSPKALLHWKGAAIKIEDIHRISGNPPIGELAALGLIRQPDGELRARNPDSKVKPPSARAGG